MRLLDPQAAAAQAESRHDLRSQAEARQRQHHRRENAEQVEQRRRAPALHHLRASLRRRAGRVERQHELADEQPAEGKERPPCLERECEGADEDQVEQAHAGNGKDAARARRCVIEDDAAERTGRMHEDELDEHDQHRVAHAAFAERERRYPQQQEAGGGGGIGQGGEVAGHRRGWDRGGP